MHLNRRAILGAHDLRRVSVAAPADPRTVRRLLRGESVSPISRVRIERALRELGFEVPDAAHHTSRRPVRPPSDPDPATARVDARDEVPAMLDGSALFADERWHRALALSGDTDPGDLAAEFMAAVPPGAEENAPEFIEDALALYIDERRSDPTGDAIAQARTVATAVREASR